MAKTTNQNQNVVQLTNGHFFVSPKEIFCGDKVFLQYQSLLTDDVVLSLVNVLPIHITDSKILPKYVNINPEICTVESFDLFVEGNMLIYQVNCVGWQIGKVIIPSSRLKLDSITIELPSCDFSVVSILEKTGESSIQPALPPILLPGTTYKVYGFVFLGIVILGLLIFTLIKSSKIFRFFKNIFIANKYKKNYKKCLNLLKKLNKNTQKLSDIKFAEELQTIMRTFFAFRFSEKVYNLATSEIISWFSSIYNLILPEQAEQAIQLFYELMLRCDFIRFSGNSVVGADLTDDEKEQLIQKGCDIMSLIEKGIANA